MITSPNENFEYGHPHSNAVLPQIGGCKPHNVACHVMKCDVINDKLEKYAKDINHANLGTKGITIFKIFIWGGILSDIWLEI